jgi:hypothetical protein
VALADDGLGERFTFDGDWIIIRVIIVGIGIGELAHQPDIQQMLIEFRLGERLLELLRDAFGALGLFGKCLGILGHRLLKPGKSIADHIIFMGVEASAHRVMNDLFQVF